MVMDQRDDSFYSPPDTGQVDRLLATIEESNGDGLATWAPEAASGVYLWSVTNPLGQKKTGKIAILR